MSHSFPRPLSLAEAGVTRPLPSADAIAMRQLRHQTKNALQRIMAQIAGSDLRATQAGASLADEVEHRICLSARVSDALFGMTACPAPLRQRLHSLADATVRLLATEEQTITVDVTVGGGCTPGREDTMVKVAHEMVSNAVKHGLHMRLLGRIELQVRGMHKGSTVLLVRDDGWGPGGDAQGEGLPIMQCLAEREGGQVSLRRVAGWTEASLTLPGAF